MPILEWNDIKDDYSDCLVLGNGASIALSQNFNYSNLYDSAKRAGLINGNLEIVFDHYESTDFEKIMKIIWHAANVNRALDVDEDKTSEAYESVKTALIETVSDVHISYDQICDSLSCLFNFITNFETVISLNYDLTVYWAIMHGNQARNPYAYCKDCFVRAGFRSDWEVLREEYNGIIDPTLVFYPHGNLILALDERERELKISADEGTNLLDTIRQHWDDQNAIPVFISEGESSVKLDSIYSSPYLRTVYNEVLPEKKSSIVIYGWSIGDNDLHILNALSKSNPRKVAVSIATEIYDNDDAIEAEIERVTNLIQENFHKDRHGNSLVEVVFFDSANAGCWCNPIEDDEEE